MVLHPIACQAFAEILIERCRLANLKKNAWARAAGVSAKDWSKYTRGTSMPGAKKFATIAEELFDLPAAILGQQLCERMERIARRGVAIDAQGNLAPIDRGSEHDAAPSYAVGAEPLQVADQRGTAPRAGDVLILDDLSPRAAELLRAIHAWLATQDASQR